MPIRILIIDAYQMVREGLRLFLVHDQDFEIVGEAADGREATRQASWLRPDLILIDLMPPGQDGISTIATLHQALPSIVIVVLSSVLEPAAIRNALRAGASGYLSKDIRASELRAAVKAAARGQAQFSPAASASVFVEVGLPELPQPLTLREREILRLMVKGYSHKEMAQALEIREATVESHQRHILAKLGVPGRANEARFLTALKEAKITVYEQDRDLRYTWMFNPLKTCTPEQFMGKTDADFVLPVEAERLTEVKQRVLQTGKREHCELQTTSPGGIYMHDLTVDPLYYSHGVLIGVTGTSIAQPRGNSARVYERQGAR
ncbi:MAG TPA: response regulator [Ktedonobacteraceae bacterium]